MTLDLSKRKVSEFMERFTKIRGEATVASALQIINIEPSRLGVVVDNEDNLMGVVGGRDITQDPNFEAEISKKLGDTNMFTPSGRVVTCGPGDTAQNAVDLMHNGNVRSCVVVDNNRPIGLVTLDGVKNKLLSEWRPTL